jgi:hypothetical protein
MAQEQQKRRIKLEIPKDLAATYANTVMISHTPYEIVYDFIQLLPSDPKARVQHRITMTPVHAKMFLNAMQENLRRYEERHGEIKLPPKPETLADQLFKGINQPPNGEDDDE